MKRSEYIFIGLITIILGFFLSYFILSKEDEIDNSGYIMSMINKCDGNNNIYICLGETIKEIEINSKDDIKNIVSIINDKNYGAFCYYAAERLGEKSYQKFNKNSIKMGFLDCETGYYHGVMLAEAKNNIENSAIAKSCQNAMNAYRNKEDWTPSMMLTCLVGVGRAVSVNEKDIYKAAGICEEILKDDDTTERGLRKAIDFCIRGVINDLTDFNSDVNEVIDSCIKLGEIEISRSNNCLAIGLREPAAISSEKTDQLAEACKKLEIKFPNPELDTSTSRYCYYALSDTIGERFNSRESVSDLAIKICSESSPCPGHLAKYLLNATWSQEIAKSGCAILANKTAIKNCNESVVFLYNALKEQGHIRD